MVVMNLLAFPDEILLKILAYSLPRESHWKQWKQVGMIGAVCRKFRRIARDLVPQNLELTGFLYDEGDVDIDLRGNFLEALCVSEWMRSRITEFHVDFRSIFTREALTQEAKADDDIFKALKSLFSLPGALPQLTWLDISVRSDRVVSYPLIDKNVLQTIPAALPKLTKLCLAGCFKEDPNDVSAAQLKRFAQSLMSPLESLSLAEVYWMSEEHVDVLLSVVGRSLTRLVLVDCFKGDFEGKKPLQYLTDSSMSAISRNCRQLESLSITDSDIEASGLAMVLQANSNIRTLDLSGSYKLSRAAAGVIAMYAINLVTLRNYCDGRSSWLDDEGLMVIIDGQLKASRGKGVTLERIGLWFTSEVTNEGLSYALANGVSTIEAEDPPPPRGLFDGQKFNLRELSRRFPDARFAAPAYQTFVDGSLLNDRYYPL